jgi:uncharacterized protein (TIGR03435 family)
VKEIWMTVGLLALSPVLVPAQAPIVTSTEVAFEVASVKPNNSGATSSSTSGRAGQFVAINVTAQRLIVYAYRLREFQIAGGPGWIRSDRFDIQARPPENAKADNPAMTRALLRDRFKLVAHTETRQEQVYVLVAARPDGRLGPRIKPSTLNCAPPQPAVPSACGMNSSVNDAGGKMTGTGQSMANLVGALGSFGLSRMVVDRTGLQGNFDFELQWTPESVRGGTGAQANDAPSIFAAIQEQLGLKLESERGPVEFLVIDRIEPPTAD